MFIPTKEQAESIASEWGTPAFVTDRAKLEAQAKRMLDAFSGMEAKIFYAVKANYNPHIVRVLKDAGIYGIDAVSVNEVRLALDLGYAPEQIAYTPSNPSIEEIRAVGNLNVQQNLGSLSEIERFCELFPGKTVSMRICPEVGAGEFEQTMTGGIESKFGLPLQDIQRAKEICDAAGVVIKGVHSHIGSGFYDSGPFVKSVEAVAKVAESLPDVTTIDVGGGFGVPYMPEAHGADLESLAQGAKATLDSFTERTGRTLELYLQPGKFLVSSSTVLLAHITTLKEKGGKLFVGLDTGFHHLIRPAMYGAYHHIINVSKPEGEKHAAIVVGNVCESGDILNRDIELVDPEEGDLIAILVAGGYGSSMSSNYNMRELAAEVLIDTNGPRLTRRRQSYQELVGLFEPQK
jgi:diaminopimelate decarboxylase